MNQNLIKHLRLALTGLAVAGCVTIASAQTEYKWTYDTAATSDISAWVDWFGNVPVTMEWSTNDAAGNPASGSLEVDANWGTDQWCWWLGFGETGNQWDTSVTVNMDLYQTEEFDIMVDPSSAANVNGAGTYGNLNCIVNIGWAQVTIAEYPIPASAVGTWTHVSLPIPKGLGSAWGPGFVQAYWDPSPGPSGPVTFYIDNLTFVPAPPNVQISAQPLNEEVFSGENIALNVSAFGGQPLAYQWYKGTSPLANTGNITGATNSTLHIAGTSASDISNYYVIITNSVSSITSSIVSLTVLAQPDDAFAATTKALAPAAFYELNETNDPSTGTLGAYDHVGGNVGLYQNTVSNAFDGISGPTPADGFTNLLANNGAAYFPGNNAKIALPPLNLNTSSATFAAWINPAGSEPGASAIAMCRAGTTTAGFVYYNSTDLGYNWANDSTTWGWDSGIAPPVGQWSFAVLVINPSGATVYLFNTTTTAANPLIATQTYSEPVQAFDGQTLIGQDQANTARTFWGGLDDVAIYGRALSLGEVTALYASATGEQLPPQITQQPTSVSLFAGTPAPAVFTVAAYGAPLVGYQWQKVGGTLGANASGVNTATLTISNLTAADLGSYEVVVTNTAGSVTSLPATLSLISSPIGAYAKAVVALDPVAFYELNETNDPSQGGAWALDNWGGLNGVYGIDVQNAFNGIAGPVPANGYVGFTPGNTAAAFSAQSANFADNVITVPPLGIDTANATFTAWINPSASSANTDGNTIQTQYAGLVFYRSGTPAGLAWTQISTNTATAGDSTLGFDWGGNYWSWNSGVTVPAGTWSFVALAVTPTNVTINVYNTNGITRSTIVASIPAVHFTGSLAIAGDASSAARIFNGAVDDVAIFNQTLSTAQLDNLAGIGGATTELFINADQLTWNRGTLLQASSLNGPWTPVAGATSPYTLPLTRPALFYRALVHN